MPFTDDDLKRLKEFYSEKGFAFGEGSQLWPLLARLEAAEVTCFRSIDRRSYCLCEACKAWRKSKGE